MTTTDSPEIYEYDPIDSRKEAPIDEAAVFERLLVEGNLEVDTLFSAQMVRDVLEVVYARHTDPSDTFTLSPLGIERFSRLSGDSYSSNTVFVQAVQASTEELLVVSEQDSAPVHPEDSLEARVQRYTQMDLENLSDEDWKELEGFASITDPELREGIEALCLSLHGKNQGGHQATRLEIVAESIGLKLPKTTTTPVMFSSGKRKMGSRYTM